MGKGNLKIKAGLRGRPSSIFCFVIERTISWPSIVTAIEKNVDHFCIFSCSCLLCATDTYFGVEFHLDRNDLTTDYRL